MASLLAALFSGGGGSTGSAARGLPESARAPSYSFARLQQLYDKLSQFRESDLERGGGGDAVVETVRQITEALIWGEQNDTNFFDFFCEKSILADFIRVLGLPKSPKSVKVQLLQTLSMLVQNIRRQTSLYYLLSGNYVNRLISMQMDFNDEEILAYFITLLKSLAMRLDAETIKFFFIQHSDPPVFPLYIEATKFFSHRDQMVRATVRTITLQVYRIEDPAMRRFVLRHASEKYFSSLALHLHELWLRLGAAVERAQSVDGGDLAAASHESELQQDLLIYLSDVFDLDVPELNEVLADRLLNHAMMPLLLSGISGRPAPGRIAGDQRVLPPVVTLYLLRQVFDTIRCGLLLEPLASALLQPVVSPALAYAVPGLSTGHTFGDQVPNLLREQFLKFLRSEEDALFLFSASVLHSCIRQRCCLPTNFLETARVLPAREGVAYPASGAPGGDCASGDQQIEVLMLLLQAFQRCACLQLDTFQVVCRITLDVFLDPAVVNHGRAQAAVVKALQVAVRATAQRLRGFLQDSNGAIVKDDSIVDTLMEEWELHMAPQVNVSDVCSNPRRLLSGSTSSSSQSGRRHSVGMEAAKNAQKAVRCFLVLRRTLADVVRFGQKTPSGNGPIQPQPWLGPSDEPIPFKVEEESDEMFPEGSSFEIGRMDRIVCGVTAPNGKHTRYLLLHDYWLLLAQPDLSAPGWVVIRTSWPLRQVQSLIDRSDPRTLRLGMHAYRGGACPGEATATFSPTPMIAAPVDTMDDRLSAYYTITLNFEDVKRCHSADVHLQRRRQEVRSRLLLKAAAFVETSCPQPSQQVVM